MDRPIVGLHLDEDGGRVAELARGHFPHVRHDPPWANRPWTQKPDGRAGVLGRCSPAAGATLAPPIPHVACEPRPRFAPAEPGL